MKYLSILYSMKLLFIFLEKVKDGKRWKKMEKDVKRCKTCEYFKRNTLHPSISNNHKTEKLLSGNCKLLCDVLKIENSNMFWMDSICVQDTFGCSLHKKYLI